MVPTGGVVVKLGGSVITRKRGAARLRPKVLHRLARELAAPPAEGLVVLHGAGSFGHPDAIKYRLAEPATEARAAERRRGAALVAAEVRRLHGFVLRELIAAGLDAWSVPTASVASNREGHLAAFDPRPYADAIARGQVPIGFGDVVPDATWGFSILSADTIAIELARVLPASRVVFASDVDGVLRSPPGTRGRPEVITRIDGSVVDRLQPTSGVPDVTGGIRGKARAMVAVGALGVDAGLISGLRHDALRRAVRGEFVYGSWSGPGSDRAGAGR